MSRGRPLLRLAGDVMLQHPDAPAGVAKLEPAGRSELLELLVRGKLPLFCADPDAAEGPSRLAFPALAHPELESALDRERRRCDGQRAAFLQAQGALAREGIDVVLVKSHGPYPYTSSNVDALVRRGVLERAAGVLERAGHHEMTHYWEPNKRLLRKFSGEHCEIMVHLHDKISWTVLAFLDADDLHSRARSTRDPHVCHLAPDHLAALLLAHSVYESSRVSIGDVYKLRVSLGAWGFDPDELARSAERFHWLPGLEESMQWYAEGEMMLFGDSLLEKTKLRRAPGRGALPAFRAAAAGELERGALELPRTLRWRYTLRKLLRDNPRTRHQKLLDLLGIWRQIGWGRLGLRHRPAALVCVCGIDGSGKSTLAGSVARAFQECELPTHRVWMRGGHSRLVEGLKAVLRRASPGVPATDDLPAKLRVYRSPGGRALWSWLVALEQSALAWWSVRIPRALGLQTLAERYVPDTLVDLAERFDDPDFARSAPGRWLRRFTPAPDLVLWLDLPGAVAHERKRDHFDPETLDRRRAHYLARLGDDPRVIRLDATRPLEALRQQAIDRALDCVLGRIRAHNRLAHASRHDFE